MRTVAMLIAPGRPHVLPAARRALAWLEKRRVKVRLREADARRLGREDLCCAEDELARGADLVLSLGGDGAMLSAARLAAPRGVVVLGLHLAGLGFLTESSDLGLERTLQRALAGRYQVEERMMLSGQVARGGKRVHSLLALNDIVVRNGAFSRLLRLRADVDGRFLADFLADGVVVSTPTGSTAYSLSASGPIVDPSAQVTLVTPICPHTLSARPLVLPARARIELQLPALGRQEQAMVTADGQVAYPLCAGDVIRAGRAARGVKVAYLGGMDFYERLRGKLGWGGTRPTQ